MGATHRKKLLEQVGDYSRSLKDLNAEIEGIARTLSREAPGAARARQDELSEASPKPAPKPPTKTR